MSSILPGLAITMLAAACFGEEAVKTEHRGAYARYGQIHVGMFGHPDGPPLTTGHGDNKTSWLKTGDRLVFFRSVKEASPWKTAIRVIKTDGTGFNKLTDGTHSDMNPTWTLDEANLVVFNRHNDKSLEPWRNYFDFRDQQLHPKEKFADFEPPARTIPRSIGHANEWLVACKTGKPTTTSFDYSGPLTETVLLGNVAYRTGEKLQWDAKNLKATNCPEADQFIHREYRSGWAL